MSERDNTNSGVIFDPHDDQHLIGQGKLNIEGSERRVIIVREPVKRDGQGEIVLYQKVGVLFVNDRKESDKSPDYSGPLDAVPNYRIAGWKGVKDGRRYMSLKASPKQNGGGGAGGNSQNGQDGRGGYTGDFDDEIPF